MDNSNAQSSARRTPGSRGVADLWHFSEETSAARQRLADHSRCEHKRVATARHGSGKRWRGWYVDDQGKQQTNGFDRKTDAQHWADRQADSVHRGAHVSNARAKVGVGEYCDRWLAGHHVSAGGRQSAAARIVLIKRYFGNKPVSAVTSDDVKAFRMWLINKAVQPNGKTGYAHGTVTASVGRFKQIMESAVESGYRATSPFTASTKVRGRNSAAAMAKVNREKVFLPTTDEIRLVYEAMPAHLALGVLLAAFAGLRCGEICGLRPMDIDTDACLIWPKQQHAGRPLKTAASNAAIDVPRWLIDRITDHIQQHPPTGPTPEQTYVLNTLWTSSGGISEESLSSTVNRTKAALVKAATPGLSARFGLSAVDRSGFGLHSLRHWFGSNLLEKHSIVEVQRAMRHEKASVTLDVYSHLLPQAHGRTRVTLDRIAGQFAELNQAAPVGAPATRRKGAIGRGGTTSAA